MQIGIFIQLNSRNFIGFEMLGKLMHLGMVLSNAVWKSRGIDGSKKKMLRDWNFKQSTWKNYNYVFSICIFICCAQVLPLIFYFFPLSPFLSWIVVLFIGTEWYQFRFLRVVSMEAFAYTNFWFSIDAFTAKNKFKNENEFQQSWIYK